ncbi:NlpC/P60 family protein [Clostridioides difficile]
MKIKKKIISIMSLIIIGANLLPGVAYASPKEDLEEKVQILNSNITDNLIRIKDLEEKISITEKEILDKQHKIIDIKKEYNTKKIQLEMCNDSKLSQSIKGNDFKVLELILKSDSVSELLQNIELSKVIIKQNNKTLKLLNVKEEQLNELQDSLKNKSENLNKDKKNLKKEQNSLNNSKKEAELALNNLIQDEKINKRNQVDPMEFKDLDFKLPDPNATPSEKAELLINNAKKFLGLSYVWGGTTPSGFDCSGLTQYVYRSIGINIPRVARDQQLDGNQVKIDELLPGDLIFFGYPAHHVGFYIGNGEYLHAPRTGDVIKISQIDWNKVSSATRFIE